ncbi:hypothetical protein Tco_0880997 [Tanacetum coccineum]
MVEQLSGCGDDEAPAGRLVEQLGGYGDDKAPAGWLGGCAGRLATADPKANLKWRELPYMERHAYCESFDETLKELMTFEHLHSDADVFVDYEWTKLMMEKYIWFRLCGREHVLTLVEFAVLLALYEESELSSKERCQKRDLWMISALEESHGINLAWVIAEHLCKHAPGLKKSFDKVVKVRTTLDAQTEGSWGFEHTKKVFKEEVIPFINSLWVSFKDFEIGLHSELNEVKMVVNQMEAAVNQYVINIVIHADSISVNVLPTDNKCLVNDNLEIERLKQENDHLFELLLSQDIVYICVNSLALRNDCREMQQGFIDEYNENLMLKAELAKKGQMLKGNNVVEKDIRLNNPNVIAPGMFKLDVSPLAPKLLNNRDAHIDYIKHSQEHADILYEIVKHARALRPLDSDLDYACKIAQQIQEVLVYVKDTCPSLTKPSEKLVVVTPLNKNKKVRMKSFTSASRSQPSGKTKHNRILRTTSSKMKNKVEDHPRSVKSKSNKMNRVIEPVCNAHVKHTMLNVLGIRRFYNLMLLGQVCAAVED